MQTEKFIRKVRPVEAVQVTEDNLNELAGWCGGLYVPPNGLGGDNIKPYIHVQVRNARQDSDKQAFPGKWVVKEDYNNFRVVTDKQFKNSYDPLKKAKSVTPSPSEMPQKQTHVPEPTQVGAVEVTPGTPPDGDSKGLTTGRTVHRSAESGEFVTEAQADANPATTVEETVKEDDVSNESFNHDALGIPSEPEDLRDPQAPEADPDGTVQLGVPVSTPELCGKCGSQVVDGVCSSDIEHDVNGTADEG